MVQAAIYFKRRYFPVVPPGGVRCHQTGIENDETVGKDDSNGCGLVQRFLYQWVLAFHVDFVVHLCRWGIDLRGFEIQIVYVVPLPAADPPGLCERKVFNCSFLLAGLYPGARAAVDIF